MEKRGQRVTDTYYYLMIGLIVLAAACSIFAQIPELNQSIRNLLNYFPWMIAVVYMLFYLNHINLAHFKLVLFLAVPLFMYLLGILFGMGFNFTSIYTYLISALVFCVGILLGENISKKHFKFVLKAICVATLIYAVYLYFEVIGGGSIYTAEVGVVDGKNSVSLIVVVPIVIMLYASDVFPKLRWGFIPFLAFLVILIGSRTSMLCCLAALIGKVFVGNRSKQEKTIYTLALLIVLYLLFINDSFYDRVINEIFLQGKELNEENIDKITSGRTEMQKGFWPTFQQTWFVGGGGYAYENFYMDTLCKYGIVGAVPVFMFAFSPIYYFFKDFEVKEHRDIRALMFALNVLMLINGLGEELPPFGPGVKCFVLWLVFGYFIGLRYKDERVKNVQGVNNYSSI